MEESEKKKILKSIYNLFEQAKKNPKLSRRYIQLVKKMAMRFNIKMPKELKRIYCHKCYSLFNSKNSKVRIKKDMRIIKCLGCGNYNRIKIR